MNAKGMMLSLLAVILAVVAANSTAQTKAREVRAMKTQDRPLNRHLDSPQLRVPESLKAEHEELHAALLRATRMGGQTGPAAKRVAGLLHPHFVREEQFALPPLGALKAVALGKTPADEKTTIEMTAKLRAEYARMLDEHRSIVGALDKLAAAARREKHANVVEFAAKLKMHAQNEEEVLYPAAMVLGEYLQLKSKT